MSANTTPTHTHFVNRDDGMVIAKIGETKTQIRCQYPADAGYLANRKINLGKDYASYYPGDPSEPRRYDYPQIGASRGRFSSRTCWRGYESAEAAQAEADAIKAAIKAKRDEQRAKADAAEAERQALYMALYEKNAEAIANATRVPTFLGELVIFEYLDERDLRQVMVAQIRQKPLSEWETEYRPDATPRWEIAVNCSNRWNNSDEDRFGSLASSSTITESTPELAWGRAMR